jgi:hypothetical protein
MFVSHEVLINTKLSADVAIVATSKHQNHNRKLTFQVVDVSGTIYADCMRPHRPRTKSSGAVLNFISISDRASPRGAIVLTIVM